MKTLNWDLLFIAYSLWSRAWIIMNIVLLFHRIFSKLQKFCWSKLLLLPEFREFRTNFKYIKFLRSEFFKFQYEFGQNFWSIWLTSQSRYLNYELFYILILSLFFQTQSTYVSLGLEARKAYLLMVLSLAQLAHVGSKYTYAQWVQIVYEEASIFSCNWIFTRFFLPAYFAWIFH